MIGVFLLLAVACGGGSSTRTKVQLVPEKGPVRLDPGDALVVFSRFSNIGASQPFVVVESTGKEIVFLGELPAKTRLDVAVPAGHHDFVGWYHLLMGDYGPSFTVGGNLEAGHAYLVTIGQGPRYALEMQAMPLSKIRCEVLASILGMQRVAPDPSPDFFRKDHEKIEKQLEWAFKHHGKLDDVTLLRKGDLDPFFFGPLSGKSPVEMCVAAQLALPKEP